MPDSWRERMDAGRCVCPCDCRRAQTNRAIVCDGCQHDIHRDGYQTPEDRAIAAEPPGAPRSTWVLRLAIQTMRRDRAALYRSIMEAEYELAKAEEENERIAEQRAEEAMLNDAPLAG